MRNKHSQLFEELRSVGASAAEAEDLAWLGGRIRALDDSYEFEAIPRHRWRWLPLAAATAIILLSTAIWYAQTSLPGNSFYPLKRTSERAMIMIYPNYDGTLMMRRSQEVAQLTAQRAPAPDVNAALRGYDDATYHYEKNHDGVYSFCEAQLRQAAAQAAPGERQHINAQIKDLN